MKLAPGARTFAAYAASACAGILGLVALNLAADRTGWSGLVTLRNYITRANG
jgi:hypothetical protein